MPFARKSAQKKNVKNVHSYKLSLFSKNLTKKLTFSRQMGYTMGKGIAAIRHNLRIEVLSMSLCCAVFLQTVSDICGHALFCRARPLPISIIVVEALCILALIAILVLVRNRLVRILSACGVEICAWQLCKAIVGPEALLTRIMTWVTAGVLIILTLAVVNSIKWRQYGEARNEEPHMDARSETGASSQTGRSDGTHP